MTVSLCKQFQPEDYAYEYAINCVPDDMPNSIVHELNASLPEKNAIILKTSFAKAKALDILQAVKAQDYFIEAYYDEVRVFLNDKQDAAALKAGFKENQAHTDIFFEGDPGEDIRKIKRQANIAMAFIRTTEFCGRIQFTLNRETRTVEAHAKTGADMVKFIAHMKKLTLEPAA